MIPTKSGREVMPEKGSEGLLFFLSKSSNSMADALDSSAPAEKPMMPILFGSMFAISNNYLKRTTDYRSTSLLKITESPCARTLGKPGSNLD